MKILKWAGIALGSVLALIAVAVGVISATFDPNKYKDQITALVKERQQRTLGIPGNLKLALFPKVGIEVGEVTLSEFKSDKPFVKLAGAKVFLEVMPLLSRQVVVDKVQIDGLNATIVRGADGKFNFDDLLSAQAATGAGKSGTPPSAGSPIKLDIDSVRLRDATISYRDVRQGRQINITQLNASTGRIADKTPTTVEVTAKVESNKPKASLNVAFKTGMTLDLSGKAFAFSGISASVNGPLAGDTGDVKLQAAKLNLAQGLVDVERLTLSVSGKRAGEPFELALNAPKFRASSEKAEGEAITGSLKMQGKQSMDAKFNLSNVSGSAKALSIGRITMDYNAKSGDSTVVGTLATALAANLEAQVFELKQIDVNVQVDNPAIPAKTVTLPIKGTARADLNRGTASADFDLKFDQSTITAKLGASKLALNSAAMALSFDVAIDKLNADRYRTPSGTSGGTATTAEQAIDLGALKALNASGNLRIGEFQVNNIKAANLRMTLRAAGEQVQVAPMTAALYGGTMNASATVDANAQTYTIKNTLSNVQINPLMKDAINKDLLEGRGNVVLDVSTKGALPSALKRALNGSVSVRLQDGAIKGINIAERIRNAKQILAMRQGAEGANKSEKTDFSEMSLSATIANGVATSDDLSLASPLLRAKGAGKVDIGASTIDYTVRPKLVATAKGQESKTYEQLGGIEMPVQIYGALDAPQFKPDYAAAAMSLAKSEIGGKLLDKAGAGGGAAGVLGGLLGKPAASASAPAGDKPKPKDLLKGLFK